MLHKQKRCNTNHSTPPLRCKSTQQTMEICSARFPQMLLRAARLVSDTCGKTPEPTEAKVLEFYKHITESPQYSIATS